MFIPKKNNQFIGYFQEDQLLGMVGFYAFESTKMIGFVSAYVLPKFRNQGIYKQLSEFRLEHVKEHFKDYSVYVTANSNSKHQLENLGFKIIEPQYRMKLDL